MRSATRARTRSRARARASSNELVTASLLLCLPSSIRPLESSFTTSTRSRPLAHVYYGYISSPSVGVVPSSVLFTFYLTHTPLSWIHNGTPVPYNAASFPTIVHIQYDLQVLEFVLYLVVIGLGTLDLSCCYVTCCSYNRCLLGLVSRTDQLFYP